MCPQPCARLAGRVMLPALKFRLDGFQLCDHPSSDASDIDYILIQAFGGGSVSLGITSFQAVQ